MLLAPVIGPDSERRNPAAERSATLRVQTVSLPGPELTQPVASLARFARIVTTEAPAPGSTVVTNLAVGGIPPSGANCVPPLTYTCTGSAPLVAIASSPACAKD